MHTTQIQEFVIEQHNKNNEDSLHFLESECHSTNATAERDIHLLDTSKIQYNDIH